MHLLIRFIVIVGLCAGLSASEPWSAWDRALPDLMLDQVDIKAGSLPDAWQAINCAFSVRGILVEDRASPADGACHITLKHVSLRTVYERLLAHYPDYLASQDPQSGITWIHPRTRPLADLFKDSVVVAHDERAVPSGTGLLTTLETALGKRLMVQRRGITARHGMEWPVDLPAQRGVLRDVLQRLLINQPSKALFFELHLDGSNVLHVISTLGEQSPVPSPGAIAWWHQAFPGATPEGPNWDRILSGVADENPSHRAIARGYLAINTLNIPTDAWHKPSGDWVTGIWANIALARQYARLPNTRFPEAEQFFRQALAQDVLGKLPPHVALLAACELTRLTKDDQRPIDVVAQRPDLATADLGLIAEDLYRLARLSAGVRSALERHRLGKELFPGGISRLGEPLALTVVPEPDSNPLQSRTEHGAAGLGRILAWASGVAALLVLIVLWSSRRH